MRSHGGGEGGREGGAPIYNTWMAALTLKSLAAEASSCTCSIHIGGKRACHGKVKRT